MVGGGIFTVNVFGTDLVVRNGELPREPERTMRDQHLEGTLITVILALVIANLVPLEAIATMGSAGFLLLFLAVNIANVRLAAETGARAWIPALATLGTAVALIVLCVEVDENLATRSHLWILVGMVLASLGIELAYRGITGRQIRLVSKTADLNASADG